MERLIDAVAMVLMALISLFVLLAAYSIAMQAVKLILGV